ncbi:MAG: cation transporter [Deltaproteobacteria bacterium CG11_big_fil_rev_8_21_14_0_20_45_16]|nr:MAG: cation transporter [Deltaproteobacteria bacterium CG11_big_fil_rev_8_21_14_0_20_45_16]
MWGGDAFVYFLSLLALNRSLKAKSKVALFNSGFELILGFGVLIEVISKIFRDVQPISSTMLIVGSFALLANLTSGAILLAHRHKDINMKAVWMCTRNDILNNFFTLIAAGCVYLFNSKWPDIMGGFLIAGLSVFFSSRVLLESWKHFNGKPPNTSQRPKRSDNLGTNDVGNY